ncbi:hypothetical protein L228DRAFT_251040 [Xylona heveae TC161]|uniref:Uncharacterized protein n=1 Tax=Xylona heveae (strain CBS 132557 / TC161) TaxID=1328760 RepID=A0A164ZS74_XYLHT|nr:hypothetical protein L228DRAFT_251040 [Xylona heveae TC161]KZF19446.1 hypothetical protein L228DRAFT_251040 [Xylona heveae TC161]
MAEPFAVIGLAMNIAQFLEMSGKLIRKGYDAYRYLHSSKEINAEIAALAADVKSRSNNIMRMISQNEALGSPVSKGELGIQLLARHTAKMADDLLEALDLVDLRNPCRRGAIGKITTSIKALSKRRTTEELNRRLQTMQKQLNSHILDTLNDKQSKATLAIAELKGMSQRMEFDTTRRLDYLKSDLETLLHVTADGQYESNVALEVLSDKLHAFLEAENEVKKEQIILQSLCFDSLKERYSTIKKAHSRTLNWLFENEELGFLEWLRSGSGIFWFSGKAGSGKSTLMKYIDGHPSTSENLHYWSGSQKLVTASHYFWNPGAPMQKSQRGLLQTLLYRIFGECPYLIKSVCAQRWNEQAHTQTEPWSEEELAGVFENIANLKDLPVKFCFLIDGLDEYDGESEDLLEIIQSLSRSSSIKICTSSRPWNAFSEALGNGHQHLTLQELTQNDMRAYVMAMLQDNPKFQKLSADDPRCLDLTLEISTRAQGVWLWVYLVVRSLLEGLQEEDSFYDLQDRLNKIPSRLEDYLMLIFKRIGRDYWEEGARILLTSTHAYGPLPILAYEYLSIEKRYPDYALMDNVLSLVHKNETCLRSKWKKKLNSHCKDLLEISNDAHHVSGHESLFTITFLHRTVRDFLETKEMHQVLEQRVNECFSPRLALLRIHLGLLKFFWNHKRFPKAETTDHRLHYMGCFGNYARDLEHFEQRYNSALVEGLTFLEDAEFGPIIHEYRRGNLDRSRSLDVQNLIFAVGSGLYLYISAKLDEEGENINQSTLDNLLVEAIYRVLFLIASPALHGDKFNIAAISMVGLLLRKGADPNAPRPTILNIDFILPAIRETVWSFLLGFLEVYTPRKSYMSIFLFEIMELLLRHGADPNVRWSVRGSGKNDYSGFSEVSIKLFGSSRAAQLERIAAEMNPGKYSPGQYSHLRMGNTEEESSTFLSRTFASAARAWQGIYHSIHFGR